MLRLVAINLLLCASFVIASYSKGQTSSDASSLEVVGTSFRLTTADGRVLTSPDLVGAILDAVDETDRTVTVRIDSVAQDPSDPSGDVWFHRFSALNVATGVWHEFCTPAADGTVAGMPLAGRWTADKRHLGAPSSFTLTCTSGAAGKCVRLGYKPWREIGGEFLWDYHQACVRMIRADYGGDGVSHTRDGTRIDVFDRLGIQQSEHDPGSLTFEAGWGPDGAVCVRRVRIPELMALEELVQRNPRLDGKIGSECSEATPALIWNRS
jgi:ADYC domain